jgi:hypothetical protein
VLPTLEIVVTKVVRLVNTGEEEAAVKYPASISHASTIEPIANATLSALAELYSDMAIQSYGLSHPVYHGAKVTVAIWLLWLQVDLVQVAEHAVATAEHDVEQSAPLQRVLQALAVCVLHSEEEDDVDENDVVEDGWSLGRSGSSGSDVPEVGFGGTSGGLGVTIPFVSITRGGKSGG